MTAQAAVGGEGHLCMSPTWQTRVPQAEGGRHRASACRPFKTAQTPKCIVGGQVVVCPVLTVDTPPASPHSEPGRRWQGPGYCFSTVTAAGARDRFRSSEDLQVDRDRFISKPPESSLQSFSPRRFILALSFHHVRKAGRGRSKRRGHASARPGERCGSATRRQAGREVGPPAPCCAPAGRAVQPRGNRLPPLKLRLVTQHALWL